MKRWRYTLGFVVLSLALLTVLYKGFGRNPHEVPFMLTGKPAPDFVLRSLTSNERVSLADLKGRPLVINFWASWCVPCQYEHPVLEWGHREYGSKAVFLGVVFEDSEDNARAFLRRQEAKFPQLIDPRSRMAVSYGVAGVPETYFIDPSGIIRGKHVGPIDPESLTRRIREITTSSPAAEAQRP
ncbi:TlpA family protein disulfide reductase [Myxococcus sp. K38C18041901]|uniref:TlpA family protein disulfide reductase n=1 Tax=Myxococcus guangdongensis TaxID=2906760 RepID=UPI0020A77D71|nr:TlpA disulfide reductase family protein [Myxococcus guangdongensis]MCP3059953.1 TlpA family protein disulfide reductase [Myxococcus guangdongensis]